VLGAERRLFEDAAVLACAALLRSGGELSGIAASSTARRDCGVACAGGYSLPDIATRIGSTLNAACKRIGCRGAETSGQ
jgi:ethanolamine ammonia-lyase large subunit